MAKRKPGRPPLPKEQQRVQFSLKMRESLLERVRDFAFQQRTTRNLIIEQAVERFLDEQEGRSKS